MHYRTNVLRERAYSDLGGGLVLTLHHFPNGLLEGCFVHDEVVVNALAELIVNALGDCDEGAFIPLLLRLVQVLVARLQSFLHPL